MNIGIMTAIFFFLIYFAVFCAIHRETETEVKCREYEKCKINGIKLRKRCRQCDDNDEVSEDGGDNDDDVCNSI